MEVLVLISTLFVMGSLFGWVLELLFRRFFTQKKWMNPGFLVGPYLPIYGFGVIVLYLIMNLDLTYIGVNNEGWSIVIKLAIIAVGMTLIELIAGLIFIKGMKIKLWDYSNRWGNFMGIICPLFSILWLGVGAIYAFFINPYLVEAIKWLSTNLIYTYFVGIVIGMILVDCAYSLHIGIKIRQANENAAIRFDEFKSYLTSKYKEDNHKKKTAGTIITSYNSKTKLGESIAEFTSKLPIKKKWWKKKKDIPEQEKEQNIDDENKA